MGLVPRVFVAALLLALGAAPAALAHEEDDLGEVVVSLGWEQEPVYAGVPNAVEVIVTSSSDGSRVGDLSGVMLTVEVSFGDRTTVLGLEPSGEPGHLVADLTPTRAGTYRLHLTGTVGGAPVDIDSTCSDETFHCVADPSGVQFPVQDPTPGQLAERLTGIAADEGSGSDGRGDITIALVALAVAVAALAVAVLGWRRQ